MRIRPIKSIIFKGKKYTSKSLEKVDWNDLGSKDPVLFHILFSMDQGAYPTYLFSEIETMFGYPHELEIESSNHKRYQPDRKNHPEYWDYKVWERKSSLRESYIHDWNDNDNRFQKRLKYQRLDKLEKLKG